jgi:hypothetical protein
MNMTDKPTDNEPEITPANDRREIERIANEERKRFAERWQDILEARFGS